MLAVVAILCIISGSSAQRVSECYSDDKDRLKREKQVANAEPNEIKRELDYKHYREGANQR